MAQLWSHGRMASAVVYFQCDHVMWNLVSVFHYLIAI